MTQRLAVTVTLFALLALAPSPLHAGGRWPARRQYIDAMHNSDQFLRDPKLAGARVRRDRKNKPLRYSGSFSTAFRMKTRSGRNIALRVFHPDEAVAERQSVEALADRYAELGRYLARLRRRDRVPPEIVDFAFVEDGIQLRGEVFPILKMPWVSGRNLDGWVDRRLRQKRASAVRLLADNWRAAMRDLRAIRVAHGDLHHGNIKLEPDGSMRLLDYDSMYAPPLAGLANSEIGHPNYQHPAYHFPARPRPFDAAMDHFSSIVIYTSLIAIAADPSLWRRYHHEDNLIFEGERDLASPDTSPVFRDLAASPDPHVRNMARVLARYARQPPGKVPDLERAIAAADRPWYQRQAGRTGR